MWRQLSSHGPYGPHAPAALMPGIEIGAAGNPPGPSTSTVAALIAVQTVLSRVVSAAIWLLAASSAVCGARPAIAAVRSLSVAYWLRSGSWVNSANFEKSGSDAI